jgi:toxin ParE1/3/4
VSEYRLSALAELDLEDISDYTTDVWGQRQAVAYLESLVECFIRIAEMPNLGRPCGAVRPGFRRVEEGKHVVFYKPLKNGVVISRILHQGMIPARHQLVEG